MVKGIDENAVPCLHRIAAVADNDGSFRLQHIQQLDIMMHMHGPHPDGIEKHPQTSDPVMPYDFIFDHICTIRQILKNRKKVVFRA